MKQLILKLIKKAGYNVTNVMPTRKQFPDMDSEFWEIYDFCQPHTMTSVERMYSLYKSVIYVLDNNIPGDFIECGVWKGGSSMMIAKTLLKKNVKDRHIYLYDTYEGMSEPTEKDTDYRGRVADNMMKSTDKTDDDSIWCYSPIEEVKSNMNNTKYPAELIHFVKGKVEDTIPGTLPSQIALLRLDTDFYESTKHEMLHLYPNLNKNGVLIVDDYGHWEGCRKAIDEYFVANKITMLFNRIDNTGRIGIKQ